jgi:hypothetical protein
LTDRQRLIFNCHDELPVKEGFDKVLAEDGSAGFEAYAGTALA